MKAIILTEFGETMRPARGSSRVGSKYESSGFDPFKVKPTHRFPLKGVIGEHNLCGGSIETRIISTSHYALKCYRCGLRIPIPLEVNTYGKLQDYCSQKRIQ